MNRTVDVRALVSHIVRGDGVDRCRICMGETSQGQVFLEDTVMLDGERPVTLAELLETLTGLEESMPQPPDTTPTTPQSIRPWRYYNWTRGHILFLLKVMPDGVLPSTLCVRCSDSAITAGNFRNFCQGTQQLWQNSIDTLKDLPMLKHDGKIYKNKQIHVVLNNNLNTMTVTNIWPKENKEKVNCECPDCGKKFKYLNQLQEHFLEAGFRKQACFYCPTVTTRKEIINHMNERHDIEPLICTICNLAFISKVNLEKHTKGYHHSGSFSCVDCGRSFECEKALNMHIIIHRPKVCSICNTQFMNMPCYFYHVQNCPSEITPSKLSAPDCYCDYCGKKFSAKKYLKTHIVIVHSRTTHSPCAYCGKTYAAAHMGTHIKLTHSTQIDKCCPTCGLVFKSDLGFKQHQRLHTGEKPYKCSFCNMRFSASSRRSEHILKVHRPNVNLLKHKCDTCTAKFRLPYQLRKHKLTVHSQSGPKDFEFSCDVCGEKFGSCRGLIHHKRKHQQNTFANVKIKQENLYK